MEFWICCAIIFKHPSSVAHENMYIIFNPGQLFSSFAAFGSFSLSPVFWNFIMMYHNTDLFSSFVLWSLNNLYQYGNSHLSDMGYFSVFFWYSFPIFYPPVFSVYSIIWIGNLLNFLIFSKFLNYFVSFQLINLKNSQLYLLNILLNFKFLTP